MTPVEWCEVVLALWAILAVVCVSLTCFTIALAGNVGMVELAGRVGETPRHIVLHFETLLKWGGRVIAVSTVALCILTTLDGTPEPTTFATSAVVSLSLMLASRYMLDPHPRTQPKALSNLAAALLVRHFASSSWSIQIYLLIVALTGGLVHTSVFIVTACVVPWIAIVRSLAKLDWEVGSPIWTVACGPVKSTSLKRSKSRCGKP